MFCHITTRIKGEKYDDLLKKVGGRGFPTFAFLDETGKVLRIARGRNVQAWEKILKELQPDGPKPKRSGASSEIPESFTETLKGAAADEKVVLLLILGEDEEDNEELLELLADKAVKRRLEKFVLFEHTFGRKDKLCRTFKISKPPRLMAIDPHEEKLSRAKLGTFNGKKTAERLAAWLKKYEAEAEK
jgi:hypothetical protein